MRDRWQWHVYSARTARNELRRVLTREREQGREIERKYEKQRHKADELERKHETMQHLVKELQIKLRGLEDQFEQQANDARRAAQRAEQQRSEDQERLFSLQCAMRTQIEGLEQTLITVECLTQTFASKVLHSVLQARTIKEEAKHAHREAQTLQVRLGSLQEERTRLVWERDDLHRQLSALKSACVNLEWDLSRCASSAAVTEKQMHAVREVQASAELSREAERQRYERELTELRSQLKSAQVRNAELADLRSQLQNAESRNAEARARLDLSREAYPEKREEPEPGRAGAISHIIDKHTESSMCSATAKTAAATATRLAVASMNQVHAVSSHSGASCLLAICFDAFSLPTSSCSPEWNVECTIDMLLTGAPQMQMQASR